MRETEVEKVLKNGIEKMKGLCLKFLPFYFTGFPDRIILLPGGRIWFVETKAPGKLPRKKQKYVHRLLEKLGFRVRVVDTLEAVEDFLIETML